MLVDTHVLLWASNGSLAQDAVEVLVDPANTVYFSPINIWEIELKNKKLNMDVKAFRQDLIAHGLLELPMTSRHVLSLEDLPTLHSDPFDRILLAQAWAEKLQFLTADETIKNYSNYLDCIMAFNQ
jgi:PIN domain nuclease of toxin-antitoxin system